MLTLIGGREGGTGKTTRIAISSPDWVALVEKNPAPKTLVTLASNDNI